MINLKLWKLTEWFFVLIFLALGVLNLLVVHAVPGILYLLLALCYSPPTATLLKKNLGITVPVLVKLVLAFLVLWGTLAVGDLAEMYGL